MAHVLVILVTKETRPRFKASFKKKKIVPFEDCLRITHSKIPKRTEIKLGHFQKLYQILMKHMMKHLLKNTLFRRATQYNMIGDRIVYHLNNLSLASIITGIE